MSKHPKKVKGFEGSLEELAESIGNMVYDQTASFIEKLADNIKKQADADLSKCMTKLASELYFTADELYKARDKMNSAWKICKPYLKE